MVKFMKKNMFQSISTDAWDVEVFNIDGSLFFGLSQLGVAYFQIYKWYSNRYAVISYLCSHRTSVVSHDILPV